MIEESKPRPPGGRGRDLVGSPTEILWEGQQGLDSRLQPYTFLNDNLWGPYGTSRQVRLTPSFQAEFSLHAWGWVSATLIIYHIHSWAMYTAHNIIAGPYAQAESHQSAYHNLTLILTLSITLTLALTKSLTLTLTAPIKELSGCPRRFQT